MRMVDLCRFVITNLHTQGDYPVPVKNTKEGTRLNLELASAERWNGGDHEHRNVALNGCVECQS